MKLQHLSLRWRLFLAVIAASVSGGVVLGAQLIEVLSKPVSTATPWGPEDSDGLPADEYISVTEKNRAELSRNIAESMSEAIELDHLLVEQHRILAEAVEASIAALLGEPDLIVAYQSRYGAKLDVDSLQIWIKQLHEWGMLESVSLVGDIDDIALFKRAVHADEERFSEIVALAVDRVEHGVKLSVKSGTPEWPYTVLVWKISSWEPLSGYLANTEGEAIKDGSSGRTAHVAVPVRFASAGEGVLRVNFYWVDEQEYWVPHMAMLGFADGAETTCPMLLF